MKDEQRPLNTENNAVDTEKVNTTEFPTVVAVDEEYTQAPRKAAHERKKRGLFRHRPKKAQDVPLYTVAELIPVDPEDETPEDSVKVYGDETIDDTREVSVSQKTLVIEESAEEEDNDEPATQMLLDGFETDEVPEEGTDEALRRIRQEKIQSFSQKREEHERAEAEQENQTEETEDEVVYPEEPSESVEETEEPVEEEMTPQQISTIRQKLKTAQHTAGVQLFVAAIAEFILGLVAVFSFVTPAVSMNPFTYLIIHLALFGVLLTASRSVVKRGLSRLFKGGMTSESGIALAAVVTVVHTALQFLNTTGISDGTTPLFTAVTGLSLLIVLVAEKADADRVSRTFALAAAKGEKLVARRIEDSVLAEEIGRPAVALGEPRVTYFRRTESCGSFLKNAVDSQSGHGFVRWYSPIVVALSFVTAIVYWLLNGISAWMPSITLLCAMVAVSSPVAVLLYLRASLAVTAGALRKQATGIVGYDAVREYGSTHAVALDAIDLFPENSVLLHGIKTFSGTRIDEAILDAASVSVRAGGPLSHVFRRMIVNKVDMLHEVDTLVYEQDMGLSGWVSGRRVLIGNRRLLDNHGIDIPSKDYEERYAKNGRQLVYLSIAGELSAMFVISYMADPTVKKTLTDLTNRRVTLLIRTCDPNITEELIASTFELNGFYVEQLGAPAGRSYEGLVDGVSACENTGIISGRGVCSMMNAVAQCRRLRSGSRFIQVMQGVLGAVACVLVAVMALVLNVIIPPLYAIEITAALSAVSVVAAVGFSRS